MFIVIALAGTFLVGMGSVVYMSLQGTEIKVPEITGKDFAESEKELASLGLKIKRRADRYSTEKPNTILEQLPRPGETVKTGQMILVVTSKTNPEGQEEPTTLKKSNQPEDDTEVIKDMISDDKPKKTNKNTNTNTNKKKADTKRDVIGNQSNSNSNSESSGNSNSGGTETPTDKGNKNTGSTTTPAKTPAVTTPAKTPTGGDVRPRMTPKP